MEKGHHEGEGREEIHREKSDATTDGSALRFPGRLNDQDQEKSSRIRSQCQTKDMEEESDAAPPIFTCGPLISSLPLHPSLSSSSSSSSSAVCLSPPLPPSVELTSVLADTRLTLDVYKGGAAALPLLWASIPEQLMGVQYLTVGSEDNEALDDALDVIANLTDLHTLTIRGTLYIVSAKQMFYSQRCRFAHIPIVLPHILSYTVIRHWHMNQYIWFQDTVFMTHKVTLFQAC